MISPVDDAKNKLSPKHKVQQEDGGGIFDDYLDAIDGGKKLLNNGDDDDDSSDDEIDEMEELLARKKQSKQEHNVFLTGVDVAEDEEGESDVEDSSSINSSDISLTESEEEEGKRAGGRAKRASRSNTRRGNHMGLQKPWRGQPQGPTTNICSVFGDVSIFVRRTK